MTRPIHMQPFFSALQDLMLASTPMPQRKPISCNACLDSGELSEGGPCNWCGIDAPCGDVPEPTEAETEQLRAIELGQAPMPKYPKF